MDSQDQVYDPLPDCYSADLARFISSCLAFRPERRPDALRLFGQAQYHVVPSQGSLSRSLDLYDASLLTGAGFKIDSPHFDADAALLWSAKERIESITQRLLEKGADVNCKTLKGETPLLLACSSQSEHLNIVRLLLKKGAEINWEDTSMGRHRYIERVNLGRFDMARLLLQTGAEVNATDSNGMDTVASCACALPLRDSRIAITKRRRSERQGQRRKDTIKLGISSRFEGHDATALRGQGMVLRERWQAPPSGTFRDESLPPRDEVDAGMPYYLRLSSTTNMCLKVPAHLRI